MATLLPPPQYDHLPSIPVIEYVLTSDAINRICHEKGALDAAGRPASPANQFAGCARITVNSDGKYCEVWRIDDATVRRHEMGHCNGWAPSHPVETVLLPPPVPRITVQAERPALLRALPGAKWPYGDSK